MPPSITHGDVFLAYFNKIWGIPVGSSSLYICFKLHLRR